jgi:hypothetical protein
VRILLISDLPEVLEPFGLAHHCPPAVGGVGEGMTVTRIRAPREGKVDGLIAGLPGEGPVVAHLTGSSDRTLRVAGSLLTLGIPYLFSPMLPSVPAPAERALAALGLHTGPAAKDLDTAGKIAAGAAAIVLAEDAASKYLRDSLGGPGAKVYVMPCPAFGRGVLADAVGGSAAGNGGRAFANLAVAYCDELAPEWNVFRLLLALERINADAVIVAGRSHTPYAEECAARAASNPRVRIVAFEPGSPADAAEGALDLLRKASIVVDPSLRGLSGAIVEAAAGRGIPSVVSRLSVVSKSSVMAARPEDVPASGGVLFAFEPTSWELLNHAITCAFNRAAEPLPGAAGPAVEGDDEERNAGIVGKLTGIYREVAAGVRG